MKCVWEHNGNDTLLYSVDYIGAYTRGPSLEAAAEKMNKEIHSYHLWTGQTCEPITGIEIVQEKNCDLKIADADSDILFESEKAPLSLAEYEAMKALVLKSSKDFDRLYNSIPNKQESCLPQRQTFYGMVPRTAQEMYEHTKSVNAYYFAEIGIAADNEGTIHDCRERGFALLEQTQTFLDNAVVTGSYDELWSLRKVMRRFLWHDRIHAKAMYKMACQLCGKENIANPFMF